MIAALILSAVIHLICLLACADIACNDLGLTIYVDAIVVPSLVISALIDEFIKGLLCRINVRFRR